MIIKNEVSFFLSLSLSLMPSIGTFYSSYIFCSKHHEPWTELWFEPVIDAFDHSNALHRVWIAEVGFNIIEEKKNVTVNLFFSSIFFRKFEKMMENIWKN